MSFDERYHGTAVSNKPGVYDASNLFVTFYQLDEGIKNSVYGALIPSSTSILSGVIADTDLYKLGFLKAGVYTFNVNSDAWETYIGTASIKVVGIARLDGTFSDSTYSTINVPPANYLPKIEIYDSTGKSVVTSGNGRITLNVTTAGYFWLNIVDVADSSTSGFYYGKYGYAYPGIEYQAYYTYEGAIPNSPPVGKPIGFDAGTEDTNYILKSADLLNGISDADGDALSITNLTSTNGKITLNFDGTWLLTPNKNFNGTLQISYTVTDNKGGNLDASFNFVLNPVNDAPTGKSTATFDVGNQNSTVFTFKDSDYFLGFSDPDGDALQAVNIKATNATITRDANGVWSLKPNLNFSGTVILAYDVIDNKGGSINAAMNFIVNHVNQSPTGALSISGTAIQGQTLTASNTLADADGLGVITYQWQADGSNISGATGSSFVLNQAQVGKVISLNARADSKLKCNTTIDVRYAHENTITFLSSSSA